MTVNPASQSAAMTAAEREVLVLKKQQDVVKEVSQSLVDLSRACRRRAASTPTRRPGLGTRRTNRWL